MAHRALAAVFVVAASAALATSPASVGPIDAAVPAHHSASADRHLRATLHSGDWLDPGESLRSRHGGFTLMMRPNGNLVERSHDGQTQWESRTSRAGSSVVLRRLGSLQVISPAGRLLWSSRSRSTAARDYRLVMRSTGALVVAAPSGATLWSNQLGSKCSSHGPRQAIIVSIGLQHLWACHRDHLVRTTPVTTGAYGRGWVTPTGNWHIASKAREVNLVGPSWNDHVKFWMDYHGPFGLHDASWQHFPEGSPKYRMKGSHGCVHVPLAQMRALYRWARIGAAVSIRH